MYEIWRYDYLSMTIYGINATIEWFEIIHWQYINSTSCMFLQIGLIWPPFPCFTGLSLDMDMQKHARIHTGYDSETLKCSQENYGSHNLQLQRHWSARKHNERPPRAPCHAAHRVSALLFDSTVQAPRCEFVVPTRSKKWTEACIAGLGCM